MDCVFCKIVNKQIPAKIIAENKNAIAFLDVEPMSDGHTIVIPKKHYANLTQCDKQTLHDVMDLVQEVAVLLKDSSLKP
jgi:histidine triad (HIT) family protein